MKVRIAALCIGLLCFLPISSLYASIPKKVKVSENDTTAGYLNGKLVAGGNISFTENTDGGNETLTLAAAYGSGDTAPEFVFIEGATDDDYEHLIGSDDPTADRTLMLPNDAIAAGDVLVGDAANSLSYLALPDTYILIGDGSGAPTAATLSGDVTIASSGAVTIAANSVALGTDTTGNYVATIASMTDGDVAIIGSGSETAAVTLDIVDDGLDFTEFADTMTLDVDTTIGTGNRELTFQCNNPTSGCFDFAGTGAYTGELVYIHQDTGNVGAGELLKIEATDLDIDPVVHISHHAPDLTSDTNVLLIDTVDDDDPNYIPFEIRDDENGNNDLLFKIDYTGTIVAGAYNAGTVTSSGTVTAASFTDGVFSLTGGVLTLLTSIDAATITEGGNAVYNSSENCGGELGGTWASPTVDAGIFDDEYIELEDTFHGEVNGTYNATTLVDGVPVASWNLSLASFSQKFVPISNADIGSPSEIVGGIWTASIAADLIDANGAVDMDYGSADITDHSFTTDDCTFIIDGGITISTGDNITLGSTQWNSGDSIDGEQIAADTIDDDSIDFTDVTAADLDLTDAGTITSSGTITAASFTDSVFSFTGGVLTLATIDDDSNTITNIDGENIKADTIDDDSIDFSDVTGADLTLTDCGAITSSATVTAASFTDGTFSFTSGALTLATSVQAASFTDGVFSFTGGALTLATIDDDVNSITNIDGENIKADTIDDDSIDFSDVTGADLTLTDATAITASDLITGNVGVRVASGATGAGFVEFMEDSDNGTEKVKLIGAAALTSDVNLVLPASYGTAAMALTTDGAGNLYWAATAGSGDVTAVGDCADGACFTGASGTTLTSNTDLIMALDNDNDGSESFQVLDGADAMVFEVAESGVVNTLVGIDAIGAVDMDYGSADVTDHSFTTDDCTFIIDGGITVSTGDNITLGVTQWNSGDSIDGEIIANDTIDNDSIDWGDMTDLTTDGEVVWGNLGAGELADDSVVADDIATVNAGRSLTWDATADAMDADVELYTDTKCIYIEDPTADDDLPSIWRNNTTKDFVISSFWVESDQTIDLDLQVDDGSPADVCGTDVQAAAGTGVCAAFAGDTTIGSYEQLDLVVTSVADTPTWVSICFTASWQD